MTVRDRVVPVGQTLRVRVLSSAIKETGDKPRVYGYTWGATPSDHHDHQDLLTSWAFERGWLLSKVFHD